jgi:hypothetical protein
LENHKNSKNITPDHILEKKEVVIEKVIEKEEV